LTDQVKCHAYHVLKYAIQLSEQADEPIELIIAALFHDIGNASCRIRKVVESEIDQYKDDPLRQDELRNLSYAFRIEHQYWSIVRTIEIMKELRFNSQTILKVIELIAKHDLRKCDIGYVIQRKDEQILNECDSLWMFTEDGLRRDQDRARENNLEVMTMKEQFEWNKHVSYIFKYAKDIYNELEEENETRSV